MVGAEGFEPPTLCSQSRCATRLRYAPTFCFDCIVDPFPCVSDACASADSQSQAVEPQVLRLRLAQEMRQSPPRMTNESIAANSRDCH